MKKLVPTLLSSLTCLSAFALPIGNPSDPRLLTEGLCLENCCDCNICDIFVSGFDWCHAWSVRFGYYGDFVFNRNLQVEGQGSGRGRVIRRTEINTNAGYIALNFCNFIDVFTALGASDLHVRTQEVSWTPSVGETPIGTSDGQYLTNTNFSWSIGARAAVFNWRCFTVGVEGQYFRFSPDITTYITGFQDQFAYFNEGNHTRYHEWQVGAAISYTFRTVCPDLALVPYVGAKWSRCHFNTHNFQFIQPRTTNVFTLFDLESHKRWGYAVGMTFTMCDMISATVEGRWGDEKALYVNGQIRF